MQIESDCFFLHQKKKREKKTMKEQEENLSSSILKDTLLKDLQAYLTILDSCNLLTSALSIQKSILIFRRNGNGLILLR